MPGDTCDVTVWSFPPDANLYDDSLVVLVTCPGEVVYAELTGPSKAILSPAFKMT